MTDEDLIEGLIADADAATTDDADELYRKAAARLRELSQAQGMNDFARWKFDHGKYEGSRHKVTEAGFPGGWVCLHCKKRWNTQAQIITDEPCPVINGPQLTRLQEDAPHLLAEVKRLRMALELSHRVMRIEADLSEMTGDTVSKNVKDTIWIVSNVLGKEGGA